ncbi:hypothetical protein HHJ61_06325 [Avibacterium paragallinarum]|nr:hypothetical protein EIA51_07230 [Avibacterium paragallinarum]QIR11245.1 hypothetical protein HBL79_02705 [Avibacterium paragallinarum]QJE09934.1 hypothetical protein HHJ62_06320 [Avibacterium paragallinarum]QJE12130.1 hypothetical protein HHJ61_06325 [Avibacterium paragallinarum]QJE14331.1 hypothetical protein HHJ60_06340 [Avibacterium paragallinarum]
MTKAKAISAMQTMPSQWLMKQSKGNIFKSGFRCWVKHLLSCVLGFVASYCRLNLNEGLIVCVSPFI